MRGVRGAFRKCLRSLCVNRTPSRGQRKNIKFFNTGRRHCAAVLAPNSYFNKTTQTESYILALLYMAKM